MGDKKKEMLTVDIYSDGSARGNPGPGGYGSYILYKDHDGELHKVKLSQGYKKTTNNRMEIMGVIKAIEWVNEHIGERCMLRVYSDSSYVVNAIIEGWIIKWKGNGWFRDNKKKYSVKNRDLWVRLEEVRKDHDFYITHVAGHANNEGNEIADSLAVAASTNEDTSTLIEDDGYSK